jgi:hypothetical protein
MKQRAERTFDALIAAVALIFSGIHIAAWDFGFPTLGEKIAWRVFIVASTAATVHVC